MGNEMGFSNLLTLLDSQEVKHRALLTDPQTRLCSPSALTVFSPHMVSFKLENLRRCVDGHIL